MYNEFLFFYKKEPYKQFIWCDKSVHVEKQNTLYDIVIEQGLMSKEELDKALDPKEMLHSHKFSLK